jgi:hypothetical protein
MGASSVTNSAIEGALTAGESATEAGLIFAAAGLEKNLLSIVKNLVRKQNNLVSIDKNLVREQKNLVSIGKNLVSKHL